MINTTRDREATSSANKIKKNPSETASTFLRTEHLVVSCFICNCLRTIYRLQKFNLMYMFLVFKFCYNTVPGEAGDFRTYNHV